MQWWGDVPEEIEPEYQEVIDLLGVLERERE